MNLRPIRLGLVFIFLFLLDRIVKQFFISYPLGSEIAVIIPQIFVIRTVLNTGIAFGFLQGYSRILTAINIVIVIFLTIYIHKITSYRMKLWFTLILAGATSNICDRFIYGGILDYIDLSFWPTFNLADTYISLGIIGIIVDAMFAKKKKI